ncbi:LuxR C-terminal-related transcriptional regulator [Streptomyces sp. NPDC001401]|uniref:LuxR C-terminal-related transcriptional regulator n=1 Tax=Streptomyces sp. NPDC001401 TaxID=3364570 RepID=UPI0036B94C55
MPRPSSGGHRDAAAERLTPNGDPLLAARFSVPVPPSTFVRRPRLVARLAPGGNVPLTLVNGPAGAGKTLLVADWIATGGASSRVAWLTVEDEDNGPGVFWTYVLEALRRHGFGPPDAVGSPARPGEVDHSLLARLAAHLSEQSEPVVLVLDEFDRVAGSTEVADELQFVLRHVGDGLRLVVISRTEPLLPLHRYRAAGQVVDIRGADLAFLPQETAELLSRHGMRLSEQGARALTEWTGGWAAGLRLCILAAQQAEDPDVFLKDFEAGRSTLADFLLAEVLDTQPGRTQDLMLRSSILEQIHPDLANALTGRDDAEPILAGLQRANAFVESIGHSWYRLHPLFAEILRVHLRVRCPGLEPELHRRAARWLSEAGLFAEALPHAADAGDWEHTANQFVEELAIGRLLTGLDAERLDRLFSTMPADTPGPAADLVRTARHLTRHDVDRGLEHLRRAQDNLHDGGSPSAARRLSCALLRVLAARMIGSADLAEDAAQDVAAAERAIPAERLEPHPELRALTLTDLGSAQLWAGRFDAARSTLSAAAQLGDGPDTAVPRHECLSRLALIDFLRGWPDRAERHAREAVAEAERGGLPPAARTGVAELVLASVALDRDELGTAHAHLEQVFASSVAPHDPIVRAEVTLLRSRLLLAKGHSRAALRVLDELEKPPAPVEPSPWVRDRTALARANAHLWEGRPEAAAEILEEDGAAGPESVVAAARARLAVGSEHEAQRLLDAFPVGHGEGPAVTVRMLLARAQAADALGDGFAAQRLTARALSTARPEELRRPFVEAGPWLHRLVRHRPELTRGHDWLPPVLVGHPPTQHAHEPGPGIMAEPLSEREHEVLERLAQTMSTEEIAADLHLSVNTVKTHLKNVYRKLAVRRRGEAVRHARELHLL